MSEPTVCITIVHYKHARVTIDCLKSIQACNYTAYHVVVLCNGCSDEDRISLHNVFDTWEKLSFVDSEENTGFAEGQNIAIRYAQKNYKPDYIFVLNNDATLEPDCITEAVAKAQADNCAMVQILQKQADDHKKIDTAGIKLTKSGLTFNIKALADPAPLFCPSGGAALYATELLETCAFERSVTKGFSTEVIKDYFDSEYFLYAEDFDLGFRALLQGFDPGLAHKAIVYHIGSASSHPMSDTAVYHTYRNLIWTYLKNYPLLWLIVFSPFLLLGQTTIFVKSFSRKQQAVIIKAWRDAWTMRKPMLVKRKLVQNKRKRTVRSLYSFMSKQFWQL